MKSTVLAVTLLAIASLGGCVTSGGNYCDIARVIRPSVQDTLTGETARQILRENEKLAQLCGVRP